MFNISICMESNPSQHPTELFVSTEGENGSLEDIPALFEKYKLLLNEDGCLKVPKGYVSVQG